MFIYFCLVITSYHCNIIISSVIIKSFLNASALKSVIIHSIIVFFIFVITIFRKIYTNVLENIQLHKILYIK